MSKTEQGNDIPDEERRDDGIADSIAAVVLVALAVSAMLFWVAGH
jgi:hypothetical protein